MSTSLATSAPSRMADLDETRAAAFLAAPYAAFLLDAGGRILDANRRAMRNFGGAQTAADLCGQPFARLTADDADRIADLLRDGAARGTTRFAMRTARPAPAVRATVFHVSLLAVSGAPPVYQLTQDHLTATADALSVMNVRRMEMRDKLATLETRHRALHQVMIATEAFAHSASHDLRTPLNTLSGMLEMFGTKFGADLPEKAHEYLSYMSRAVVQMDALTTDFLDHARSAGVDLVPEPVDLRAAIGTSVAQVQGRLDMIGGTVRGPDRPFTLMAEPALLGMLLGNLLTNAIKYRHAERPLALWFEVEEPQDARPVLRVHDNGRGFAPHANEAIFLPFRRLDQDIEGTGVGLATCREVCRRHGWTITARSDGASGATFQIIF